MLTFRAYFRLLERNGIHQAALAPGRVQAALEFQRTVLADVALKNLGVIAARLDGLQDPLVVETEPRSELAGGAEQALDRRHARGFRHFVGIGRGDAELFRLDQAVVKPGDDVAPRLVAV